MTLRLDAAFHERAEHVRLSDGCRRLVKALLPVDASLQQRTEMQRVVETIWQEGRSQLGLSTELSISRYVLMILTQHQWANVDLHWRYARRMIGVPDRSWSLEAGLAAVYLNVLAGHYLGQVAMDYMTDLETKA